MKRKQQSTALTIAGSDSGGGAGVQADLKTFAACGVHGTCAITCLTAQNPKRVLAVKAVPPAMVRLQLEAVFAGLRPAAVKTGMLYSGAIIREVARWFQARNMPPFIVDPVMVSTSGAKLLKPSAIKALTHELLPLATLVTPNLDEAELLTGRKLEDIEGLRWAARELRRRYGCAALVKGGHLRGLPEAVDIFHDGREELMLTAQFVRGVSTHGTGCTYSAAITAGLAQGFPLAEAVVRAKEFITKAIAGSVLVRKQPVLNWFGK